MWLLNCSRKGFPLFSKQSITQSLTFWLFLHGIHYFLSNRGSGDCSLSKHHSCSPSMHSSCKFQNTVCSTLSFAWSENETKPVSHSVNQQSACRLCEMHTLVICHFCSLLKQVSHSSELWSPFKIAISPTFFHSRISPRQSLQRASVGMLLSLYDGWASRATKTQWKQCCSGYMATQSHE